MKTLKNKAPIIKLFLLSMLLSIFLVACPLDEVLGGINLDDSKLYEAQSDKSIYQEASAFEIDVYIQEFDELIELGARSDKYIDKLIELYEASGYQYDHHDAKEFIGYVDVSEAQNLAVFEVTGDEIRLLQGALDQAQEQRIRFSFKLFTNLVPAELRTSLKKIDVYNNNGTAAYISFEEDSINTHILGLNADEMIDETSSFMERYQISLLFIHELAHLISMQEDQVSNYGVCFNPLGETFDCHREDSYMNRFNQLFWSNVDIYFRDNSNKSDDDLAQFYELNEGNFLNSYAASNPYEDFAESFMTFVTEYRPEAQESGLDKKIMFFYQYDEMILIREALLENMVNILSR